MLLFLFPHLKHLGFLGLWKGWGQVNHEETSKGPLTSFSLLNTLLSLLTSQLYKPQELNSVLN